LHIWEITNGVTRKRTKAKKRGEKTDWERNLTKLRSRERALDAQEPVKPVKTD